MRLQAWVFCTAIAGAILTIGALLLGNLRWTLAWAMVSAAAAFAARAWARKSPGPMPYAMRWLLLFPRGFQSPQHLTRVLQPLSGEHILEIGPGIGVHAIPVASSLTPGGVLEVLDVQRRMLADLMRRATKTGVRNIVPTVGNAQKLPFRDDTFDAAYLISVLGEIPDRHAALRELRRVLKPSARLVVGEFFIDPDFISVYSLQEATKLAGFAFDGRIGPSFSYLARFRAA